MFGCATTYTCLLFLDRQRQDGFRFEKVDNLEVWRSAVGATHASPLHSVIPADRVTAAEWNFAAGSGAVLFEKLAAMPLKLGDVADIFVGLQTSADDVFIMDLVRENTSTLTLKSKALGSEWEFEKGLVYPLVSGTDVCRYAALAERQYILFPYEVNSGRVRLLGLEEIRKHFPRTAEYLLRNKHGWRREKKGSSRVAIGMGISI